MRRTKFLRAGLISLGFISLVLTSGCLQNNGAGTKEQFGTIGGAVIGGLLGAQIGDGSGQLAAVAAGTLLGAFIGNDIGASLDKADQLYAERTAQTSLESAPTGETSSWANPDNGHEGTFTPTDTYYIDDYTPCREYQQTVTIGGRTETAYGTACRDANGDWRIKS
ncbi:MAG: hypothetical protein CMM30_00450 [Rhodospirillaceae bacterium]|nr:hypothetical protein [Alphaproteobacteria bacterium]MBR71398.1 hypothetical protein [Rhodospirillaceae bacterium]|tara:strand:+ start:340 stop:837 length:498 start_codon:yes stop_codon:yes gene_type:complete